MMINAEVALTLICMNSVVASICINHITINAEVALTKNVFQKIRSERWATVTSYSQYCGMKQQRKNKLKGILASSKQREVVAAKKQGI